VDLLNTLATLAPTLNEDQAERLAIRVLDLLGKTTEFGVVNLGNTLAALTPLVKEDQAQRVLLARFIKQRRAMPCDVAVAKMEDTELLVDMLKWPDCKGRDGVMLRIAEVQNASASEFGEFKKAGDRSSFQADLRKFITWLKTQRMPNGKPFDVDGPPRWSPTHTSSF
jgi:hypothetical protein